MTAQLRGSLAGSLAARRAAQLAFPCGAFVFFLDAFDSILVLVAIVR
jgi:hypothetical protein